MVDKYIESKLSEALTLGIYPIIIDITTYTHELSAQSSDLICNSYMNQGWGNVYLDVNPRQLRIVFER